MYVYQNALVSWGQCISILLLLRNDVLHNLSKDVFQNGIWVSVLLILSSLCSSLFVLGHREESGVVARKTNFGEVQEKALCVARPDIREKKIGAIAAELGPFR